MKARLTRIRPRALASVVALSLAIIGATAGAAGAANDNIFTVAGLGTGGFLGDGGPATSARLDGPRGVAWMPDGGYLIADFENSRVRRVWPNGQITTVAGTGVDGYNGDGRPAIKAQLNFVHGVAPMPDGSFLIADPLNRRVRRVAPGGTITTVAGTGTKGYSGDGGRATSAQISDTRGIAATGDGGFLIADTDNHVVRRVSPNGTITTVAGTGDAGFSGDGGSATQARLQLPFSVSPVGGGGFLIADNGNRRVRLVSGDGRIATVAGNGSPTFSSPGRSATETALTPTAVAATPGAGFLVADNPNRRVYRVSSSGLLTTVAGTGAAGSAGDGGPASGAQVNGPRGLAVRPDGRFLIAEFDGDRVRFVGDTPPVAKPLLLELRRRLRGRARQLVRVRYRLSETARVKIEVRSGRRRVARFTRRGRRGSNRLTFPRRLKRGRYVVTLRARTTDGRTIQARARLSVTNG